MDPVDISPKPELRRSPRFAPQTVLKGVATTHLDKNAAYSMANLVKMGENDKRRITSLKKQLASKKTRNAVETENSDKFEDMPDDIREQLLNAKIKTQYVESLLDESQRGHVEKDAKLAAAMKSLQEAQGDLQISEEKLKSEKRKGERVENCQVATLIACMLNTIHQLTCRIAELEETSNEKIDLDEEGDEEACYASLAEVVKMMGENKINAKEGAKMLLFSK